MKRLTSVLVVLMLMTAVNANANNAVEEGKNTAYMASTGAIACGITNFAANKLGLSNKWATLGTMVVGTSLAAMITERGDRGNVDVASRSVGCMIGSLGVGTGVYIGELKAKRVITQDELLKNTTEAKYKAEMVEDLVNKRLGAFDTRLAIIEKGKTLAAVADDGEVIARVPIDKREPVERKPVVKYVKLEKKAEVITVKPGDTLAELASAHDTTVEDFKKENGLKSDVIHVGDTLKIPRT